MNKNALVVLSALSLLAPACVVTTTQRDVGSVAADGTVYLGWHLINRNDKTNQDDQEIYDVGPQLGTFSSIRLYAEKPVNLTQVLVIFADGERWVAPAPAALGGNQWTGPIALPRGPRAIHSVTIFGRASADLLAKVEVHGNH